MLDGMEGKVAIVTGAGRGLGRAEALELARQGVRVVVNDFGTTVEGGGSTDNPAHEVVAEIKEAGGEAVAHLGDVADWADAEAMVRLAVDTWGHLDILVNNAGVLRDRMLYNMSEEEWDLVVRVHMKGHFCTLRHATKYWRDAAKASADGTVYGRAISTASEAMLFNPPGQPNYAAAKAGIVALTLAAAQAVGRFGATANAIAPRALTRMTESLGGFDIKEGDFDVYAPENVSPLVAYLASPASAKVSGQLFVVYGREISVVSGPTTDTTFRTDDRWTPEGVDGTLSGFYESRTPVAQGYLFH